MNPNNSENWDYHFGMAMIGLMLVICLAIGGVALVDWVTGNI